MPPVPPISSRLLRWFDAHKRNLPWRQTRDPYRIWLAEIMLQQTRVPVVIPYYQRFLQAFPTMGKLAQTREERVLRLWAGLGYYQRARNLHRAAHEIVHRHGGLFPRTLEKALTLPGVGAYTARAVLSIGYGQPAAVVDGNVARVLARLFLLRNTDGHGRAALQPLADGLVSRRRPGDFNQALMELGSTVCLPRIPRCEACPLAAVCAARQAGLERTVPQRVRKRARPQVRLSVLVVSRNGSVMVERERRGYFSGLWHFPYQTGIQPQKLARSLGAGRPRYVSTLVHETTMRDLVLRVYRAEANGRDGVTREQRWVKLAEVPRLGVGAATRKIAALLADGRG